MTPVLLGKSNLAKLEDLKKEIRSLLISMGNRDVTLPQLDEGYKDVVAGIKIPYADFYYTSLKEFLSSMPDVVQLRYNDANQLCAYHVDTEKSQHVSKLVAKEKKTPKSKLKLKRIERYNPVDPCILIEALQEVIKSHNYTNKCERIRKTDLFSEIINRLGKYTFYTIRNLNNQLNEFTHILTHDDDYIYLKNESVDKKIQKPVLKNFDKKSRNNQLIEITETNSAGILIKNTTKIRLRKLIEKYPEGIWCSELPSIYKRENGLDLEYNDLGFNSVIEFVAAVPDILQIVKPVYAKKQMVLDARIPVNNSQMFVKLSSNVLPTLTEATVNDTEAIPSILSSEVSKTLIPEYVVNFNDTLDQINVTSLLIKSDTEKFIHVIVSEVFTPSFFWVILHQNKRKLIKLMNQLQEFYSQQDLDKYIIPQVIFQPGLHIACKYDKMWHRGIIKSIQSDDVDILFYDYGTISTYNISELYFLDKRFSTIPAQAIPCSLYNVKPIGKSKWPLNVSKIFLKKVLQKSFVASIFNIDEENNSMSINLIDTRHEYDNCINQWMISHKLADVGEYIFEQTNNHKNHEHYTKENDCSISNNEYTKVIKDVDNRIHIIPKLKNGSTSNYISSKKKMEAIKKYQESLKFFPTGICSNNDSMSERNNFSDNIFETYKELLNKQVTNFYNTYENEKYQTNVETFHEKYNNSLDDTPSSYNSTSINSFICDNSNEENSFNQLTFKSGDEQIEISNKVETNDSDKKQNITKDSQIKQNKILKDLQKLISCTKL